MAETLRRLDPMNNPEDFAAIGEALADYYRAQRARTRPVPTQTFTFCVNVTLDVARATELAKEFDTSEIGTMIRDEIDSWLTDLDYVYDVDVEPIAPGPALIEIPHA